MTENERELLRQAAAVCRRRAEEERAKLSDMRERRKEAEKRFYQNTVDFINKHIVRVEYAGLALDAAATEIEGMAEADAGRAEMG